MHILCAPDSFKESLTAAQAAAAMHRGILRACPDATIDLCPIADGGEGTVDALVTATQGQRRTTRVQGPLHDTVDAAWGLDAACHNAFIEMAAAAGLALVPPDNRNPLHTTTFGVGELLHAALDERVQRIILGIGGSATNDAGLGMAQALGVHFFDAAGHLLDDAPLTGADLTRIARIDATALDPRLRHVQLTVACDVTNPLCGPNGAAAVYGPQKGATPAIVQQLDAGLAHLAERWRIDLGKDVAALPGAGAAGGLGGGLVAFLNATLQPGIGLVLDALDFTARIARADLCLTGEGRLDSQSLAGKACAGVAAAARQAHVPTIALVGSIAGDTAALHAAGFTAMRAISEGLPLDAALRDAATLLERATEAAVREQLTGLR